jgi:hypothetical protein
MFLAKNSLAKNFPPIRKKNGGEEFSGKEFSDKECSDEESSSEEFSGNPFVRSKMRHKYEVDGSKQTLIASSAETADAIIVSI